MNNFLKYIDKQQQMWMENFNTVVQLTVKCQKYI